MIKSKEELKEYLLQDAKHLGLSKSRVRRMFNPIWRFQKCLRRLEYYSNSPTPWNLAIRLYYKLRFRRLSLKLGFSIPINVFGPGLSIAHYGTIVVNPNARVGKNCRLHACVNIGASGGRPEAPQIGDNCYIGPGALIFGDIRIEDNVTIAANATVNKTFKENNILLAGVPAKILRENQPDWTITNNKQ